MNSDWLRYTAASTSKSSPGLSCTLASPMDASAESSFDLLEHMGSARIDAATSDLVSQAVFMIEPNPQVVLFQHPPSSVTYSLRIPLFSRLVLSLALSPEVWHVGMGDGVQFDAYLQDEIHSYHILSEYIDPKNVVSHRQWHDREINLSPWAGQTMTLTLVTDAGPNGDDRYDWAGWGEPRILQPTVYDFLTQLPTADTGSADQQQVRQDILAIDYEPRHILFQHPPSRVTYRVEIPEQAGLHFGLGMDPAVWSPDRGDGVAYSIYVRAPDRPSRLYRVFHRYVDPKNGLKDRYWLDQVVDLSVYGGQTIDLIFEAQPGPANDASFDWGGWSRPILVADDLALPAPLTPQ